MVGWLKEGRKKEGGKGRNGRVVGNGKIQRGWAFELVLCGPGPQ